MNTEIIETPIRFRLHGSSGVVEDERYAEVGRRLVNEMWEAVKGAGVPTTGINHWVYLPTTGCSSVSNSAARRRPPFSACWNRWSSSCRGT